MTTTIGKPATADLSSAQYQAVGIGGTVVANNTLAHGILQNKPQSGEDMSILVSGLSRFKAGAAVSAGGRVIVTASGFIITATSGTFPVGYALEAVSSGGIGEGFFDFANAKTNLAG